MYSFEADNLNKIYRKIYDTVENEGININPRGKPTKELQQTIIKINKPRERFCSSRPMFNIFFSCAEVLWILSGESKSDMICHYLKNFTQFLDKQYSADFHGAYGARIFRYGYDERNEYDTKPYVDQFYQAYKKLKNDIGTRQAVINLWSPWKDNLQDSRDYVCNNICYLKIRDNKLNWTQIIRSNDLIYGVPQNIFQFTHLQEIMASMLNIDVGYYVQFSDSLHIYENDYYDKNKIIPNNNDIYETQKAVDIKVNDYKDFKDTVRNLSFHEQNFRRNKFSRHIEEYHTYWDSFISTIKIFNLLKYNKIDEAYTEVRKIHNEYKIPVFEKIKVKENAN